MDYNCGSLLNVALLWQRRKAAESPIYQVFPYFLYCPNNILSLFLPSLLNVQHKILKTYTILVYEHGDILWIYQEAKIKILIFYDFSLIVSL